MIKTFLPYGIGFGIGVCIGGVAIYAVYKYLKSKDPNNEKLRKEAEYEAKNKIAEESKRKLDELLKTQTSVETLNSKEVSAWFKENKDSFTGDIRMIIAIPTDDILKRLQYPTCEEISKEKNLLQWFYDESNGKVLKIRLIIYENIDSNFQARLLENKGMLVIKE